MTDTELVTELRTESHKVFKELIEAERKGFRDPDAIEKLNTLEKKLNETEDKRAADAVIARKFFEGHAAPPPGGSGPVALKSFGARFTESAEFKAFQPNGRHAKMATTVGSRVMESKVLTEAGSGFTIVPQRSGIVVQLPPRYALIMRSLVDVVPISGTNAIEYMTETFTSAADYQVAEGDKKAESTAAWTPKTALVRTIAHYIKVSRQMWADVPYIAGMIDNQLIYGVLKKEDHEILWGDNAAGHIHGIMPQATLLAGSIVSSNFIDEIMRAIAQVEANGYSPNAIVMNPADFGAFQIQKNAQGFYVLGGPPQGEASRRLWGLPIYTTPEMTAKTALVAQFPGTATLFDREAATVDVAYENEDDFVRNLVCIRCEERIAFAVYAPPAYVKVTIPPVVGAAAAAPAK